ncbi:Uncharacterized protein YwqG [Chitinophaga sp. YR573]|uniref:YwqG family protein n=1 Tax=Chitinophaga sp. YR573 TaxID=1881040 RepID=UPI0008C95C2B|nr:DUF1963 domain-containing protein [Chitinophaga sp. YR573]SEW34675.1 Uncharacterized protein YwqG [Chitinophaga sp. YR573]
MFPKSLQPYQRIIESTAIPSVLLSLKEEKTELYQSKIGGEPYFPCDYPLDMFYLPYPDISTVNPTPWPKHRKTGRELMLLLQINFEEMPPLPSFPKKGILQLFVDDRNWHNLQDQLQVIYHPQVIRKKELLFSDFDNPLDSYRISEYSLSFRKETEYITTSDFRFEEVLPYDVISGSNRLWMDYLNLTERRYSKQDTEPGYGMNKIGGYHYSQNNQDPRKSLSEWKDSLLLAQFQNYEDLSWGDVGSAQFFIRKEDLENLNFQNLLFHWDST